MQDRLGDVRISPGLGTCRVDPVELHGPEGFSVIKQIFPKTALSSERTTSRKWLLKAFVGAGATDPLNLLYSHDRKWK